MQQYRRAGSTLLAVLVVYAALVATNRGEFWPFSIYPMFSQAGNNWSRVVVRDVSGDPAFATWDAYAVRDLPGEPFPLAHHDVNTNDLAALVGRRGAWDDERRTSLKKMMALDRGDPDLLVLRVDGRLVAGDSVLAEFVPVAVVTDSSMHLSPRLETR